MPTARTTLCSPTSSYLMHLTCYSKYRVSLSKWTRRCRTHWREICCTTWLRSIIYLLTSSVLWPHLLDNCSSTRVTLPHSSSHAWSLIKRLPSFTLLTIQSTPTRLRDSSQNSQKMAPSLQSATWPWLQLFKKNIVMCLELPSELSQKKLSLIFQASKILLECTRAWK